MHINQPLLESTDSTSHQPSSPFTICADTLELKPSCRESGMRLVYFNLVYSYVIFYTVGRNAHS